MTNNEILESVSGDIKSIISNMAVQEDHKDDLFQDVSVILLKYDNKKLDDIYQKGQLKFFVSRILTNQYYSVHSAFYKTYKKYENNKYNIADILGRNGREPTEE